ncbi:MAG TPA: hypothetical protein VED66_14635 [Candidatus Sulfotelmatobacter sp.]|nr:hypothetical protein [Candidatus Sulfotelmatobacter sp.]
MPETNSVYRSRPSRAVTRWVVFLACAFIGAAPIPAKGGAPAQWKSTSFPSMRSKASPSLPAQLTTASEHSPIPPGTILPVILRTTISLEKVKQGQVIYGKIAQEVPLPGGSRIRKGSKVEGRVVAVLPAGNGTGAKISVRFDKVYLQGKTIPITTDLRAIAGFMEVLDAGTPNQAMGEGDVSNWMTTRQIGGDSVFGVGGPVTSAHNANEVVGKSLMSGGVLVQVRPNELADCRGAVNGNNAPQALWVFSSDACGTYGLLNVRIAHAGRTDPVGTITLEVQARNAKIQNGAGLLLRVIS